MQSKQQVILRRRGASNTRSRIPGPPGFAPTVASTGTTTDELTLEHAPMTPTEVADIQRDPAVICVAPAMPLKLVRPFETEGAQESSTGNTWGVEAVRAHTSSLDGAGVVVAVLDTGINPSHRAFAGVQLARRNFTQGPDDDDNGHGTHCAGTIFGRDVNGLRIGVARGITKALIGKVLGPKGGSSATLAEAINWAYLGGAHVISMSLGIDFPGYVAWLTQQDVPLEAATSMALEEYRANVNLFSSLTALLAQTNSFAQAAVVVAASGNESQRPRYEVAVAPPAAGEGMIAVGALGRAANGTFSVASFSNSRCNLSGPGVAVTSAWIGGPQELRTISGTSMATPHVAGCAALWAQQLARAGALTAENLTAKILASATPVAGEAFDDVGNGLVLAPQ